MAARTPRILVVTHTMVPDQMRLWVEVSQRVPNFTLLGTRYVPKGAPVPMEIGVPSEISVTEDRPVGLLRRGHLWWRYPKMASVVRDVRPEIIHVVSEAWGLLSRQALSYGKPTVVHGAENVFAFGNLLERQARLLVLKSNAPKLAGYASWNTAGAAALQGYGLHASRPTVVVPAVVHDHAKFSSAATSAPSRSPNRLQLAFVGRLVEEKGGADLIDAVAACSVRHHVTFVGSGPSDDHWRTRAQQRSISFEFVGSQPRHEVARVLQQADLCVLPSRTAPHWREQFGRVALESMACGTPVFTSNSGALPEVINDDRYVFAERNVAQLTAMIDRFHTDANFRDAAVMTATERARFFSASAVADRLIAFWDQL